MSIFTAFLKNKNIIFKIRRSKVTDYAALISNLFNEHTALRLIKCSFFIQSAGFTYTRGLILDCCFMRFRVCSWFCDVMFLSSDPVATFLRRSETNWLCLLKEDKLANTLYFGTYRICAKHPLDPHADVYSGAWSLQFGLSLHLHTYFVYASSEGSSEYAHMRRLARAFIARQCDKSQNLMRWLKLIVPT